MTKQPTCPQCKSADLKLEDTATQRHTNADDEGPAPVKRYFTIVLTRSDIFLETRT